MKTRKVLHVSRIVDGGIAVVIERLTKELNKGRFKPIVLFGTSKRSYIRDNLKASNIRVIGLSENGRNRLLTKGKNKKSGSIGLNIKKYFGIKGLNVYQSIKSFYYFIRYQLPEVRNIVRVIRVQNIDIVHTHHDLGLCKPEAIASWITGVPCISHNHSYMRLTAFDRLFSYFIDSFVYISNSVSEFHIKNLKSSSKGNVIHNGIDIQEYEKPQVKNMVIQELGINGDAFLVGIIGRIDWWKGHDYFLRAIKKASDQISDLKGIIIGELEQNVTVRQNLQYFNNLNKLIKNLNLENRVIFTGNRTDIPKLMSALDVVVHASTEPEPFGLVIIEGMAAGKPVIATAAGGVLEIIENNINGIVVPPKDSNAIAQAIIDLASNKENAHRIGIAAHKHVQKNFTIEFQVKALERLYDSIL